MCCQQRFLLISHSSVTAFNMRLHEFLSIIENKNKLIDFLLERKVIHEQIKCPKCNTDLNLNREHMLFICYSVRYEKRGHKKRRKMWCNFRISPLHNSWFSHSHLSMQDACRFIAYFLMIRPPRQLFLMEELGMQPHTVVDWSNFCRELCLDWLEDNSEMLGGPDCTVEIDEAKIGKRKFQKGRLITGQWIFGGIERETGKLFIECVPNRSAETLLTVIQKWIKPGTTIVSDCWKAYKCLEAEGYKHITVNHSYNFVDPESKAHTQNIERAWRDTRGNIPRYGTRKQHYAGYIAEFLFKRKFSFSERIEGFFDIMQKYYPPSL